MSKNKEKTKINVYTKTSVNNVNEEIKKDIFVIDEKDNNNVNKADVKNEKEEVQITKVEEVVEEEVEEEVKINEEVKVKNEEVDINEEVTEKVNINSNNYDTLVLSGGSIRGIMLLGALQYATDNYLLNDIKTYIGTSIGSIIGYLLAIGYTPIEIMVYVFKNQIFDKIKYFNIVAAINGNGATSFSHIHEHLEKMTIEKIGRLITLKDLYTQFNKTLICTTYNLTKSKVEYLSYENFPDIPCLIALRMSSNLPLIFDHFKYMGSNYIDGAISNNFPIDIGDKYGKKILGVYITEHNKICHINDKSILEYIFKLMLIPVNQSVQHRVNIKSDNCYIIGIETDTNEFFNFNITSTEKLEMFSTGYTKSKKYFEI